MADQNKNEKKGSLARAWIGYAWKSISAVTTHALTPDFLDESHDPNKTSNKAAGRIPEADIASFLAEVDINHIIGRKTKSRDDRARNLERLDLMIEILIELLARSEPMGGPDTKAVSLLAHPFHGLPFSTSEHTVLTLILGQINDLLAALRARADEWEKTVISE